MSASTVEPIFTEPTASYAYNLLLQDARWLGLGNGILKRDKNACRLCGTTQMLKIHHWQYPINTVTRNGLPPWQYHPDLLVTLCPQCAFCRACRVQGSCVLCTGAIYKSKYSKVKPEYTSFFE